MQTTQEPTRAERATRASLPSLVLLSLTFFMPFLRVCSEMQTPLGYVNDEPVAASLWIGPRFYVAALLAIIVGVAILRRRLPGRVATLLAALGIVTCMVSMGFEWSFALDDNGREPTAVLWFTWLGLASAGGLAIFARAWFSSGWARWIRFIAAYAVLASPMAYLVLTAARDSSPATPMVGIGGWLFVVGIVFLLGIAALGLRSGWCCGHGGGCARWRNYRREKGVEL